nr:immunoglobulin heavy chain junction region [Macaca mulatta]MOW99026.1 immunoglobulin heavy chain junction region [Macaca mulatta]MOX00014.1 immunoglobulin heavy chain junction region [Macaca mulatta]MOX00138.1 immunoglobulin heavy chain junction region [Macaca mulatta]MOX01527.1 immunoglobulin heavy chain junction region [Macaca mulatta]
CAAAYGGYRPLDVW